MLASMPSRKAVSSSIEASLWLLGDSSDAHLVWVSITHVHRSFASG